LGAADAPKSSLKLDEKISDVNQQMDICRHPELLFYWSIGHQEKQWLQGIAPVIDVCVGDPTLLNKRTTSSSHQPVGL
jgi:hypothetical protein